jgi:hypothetical protein
VVTSKNTEFAEKYTTVQQAVDQSVAKELKSLKDQKDIGVLPSPAGGRRAGDEGLSMQQK